MYTKAWWWDRVTVFNSSLGRQPVSPTSRLIALTELVRYAPLARKNLLQVYTLYPIHTPSQLGSSHREARKQLAMAILCGYCHHPKLWHVRLSISTELVSLALYIRLQLLDIPLTKALIKLELNR